MDTAFFLLSRCTSVYSFNAMALLMIFVPKCPIFSLYVLSWSTEDILQEAYLRDWHLSQVTTILPRICRDGTMTKLEAIILFQIRISLYISFDPFRVRKLYKFYHKTNLEQFTQHEKLFEPGNVWTFLGLRPRPTKNAVLKLWTSLFPEMSILFGVSSSPTWASKSF